MKSIFRLRYLLFVAVAGMFLAGCLFKPVTDPTRHFVLTPISAEDPTAAPPMVLFAVLAPRDLPFNS